MNYATVLWRPTTTNTKTGNIPTAWVGATREESIKSCVGCPLLEDGGCYTGQGGRGGTVATGHSSMIKRANKTDEREYSLENALRLRWWGAKYVRWVAIGDPSATHPDKIREVDKKARAQGLGVIPYSHFPKKIKAQGNEKYYTISLPTSDWKGDAFSQVKKVFKLGFKKATVVLPFDYYKHSTPKFTAEDGEEGLVCAAQWGKFKGKPVTCNDCGWCDPQSKGPRLIGFVEHSKKSTTEVRRLAKQGVEWAMKVIRK